MWYFILAGLFPLHVLLASVNFVLQWRLLTFKKLMMINLETKVVFICNPLCRPGEISANRYNVFNVFIWQNKSYNSFRLTVYMSALFLQTARYEKQWTRKKTGLILTATIYQMYAVLNLRMIYLDQKIDNIIFLLVKQNVLIYCHKRRTSKCGAY